MNKGNFEFEMQFLVDYPGVSFVGFRSVGTADYNGDGPLDFIFGDHEDGIFWVQNTSTSPLTYAVDELGGVTVAFSFGHADYD